MYLKSDISFYVFHVVCGLHYDNASSPPCPFVAGVLHLAVLYQFLPFTESCPCPTTVFLVLLSAGHCLLDFFGGSILLSIVPPWLSSFGIFPFLLAPHEPLVLDSRACTSCTIIVCALPYMCALIAPSRIFNGVRSQIQ